VALPHAACWCPTSLALPMCHQHRASSRVRRWRCHFWRFALATPLTRNRQPAKALTHMTPPFKISSDTGLADTLNDRCEAMALPQYDGELPPYRCTREAGTDRKGRRVCEAHSRTLHRLTFCDDADAGVLHG
jgi:hypothetical protein